MFFTSRYVASHELRSSVRNGCVSRSLSLHEVHIAFADLEINLCDFANRALQHGEDTKDSLDGILRITVPHTSGLDAPKTVKDVLEALIGM